MRIYLLAELVQDSLLLFKPLSGPYVLTHIEVVYRFKETYGLSCQHVTSGETSGITRISWGPVQKKASPA